MPRSSIRCFSEGLTCAMNDCHMGITAEEVAARYVVSRADQDAFAAESQRRAGRRPRGRQLQGGDCSGGRAAEERRDPVRVEVDEYPRPGTTAEKLAALKPAFKKDGSVTAGNASGINDGAAALVVTTAARAARAGRPALARILAYASTGVDPTNHGHRAGAGRPPRARPRATDPRGDRSLRAERSVRGPVGRRDARAWTGSAAR